MAGLGDMFGQSFAAVNGGKPRNSNRIQAGQPLNLRGAFEAATNIPGVGDALSGGMAMYDAAKGDYGSAAMNALGVLPFVSGTFIGKGAKTFDFLKAADAEKRIAAGDDVRKVWKETGTFKGPDGHLRQEIPDNKSFYRGSKAAGSSYAEDVFLHPELYDNYPVTRGNRVIEFDGNGGSFEPNPIAKGAGKLRIGQQDASSTTLHELQHAIQGREGWAKGGSPESWMQQEDAKLARDALSWRRELLSAKQKAPDADTIALENNVVNQYQQLGAMDWVPSRDARDLARQPDVLFPDRYPNSEGGYNDLQDLVKAYGLDKNTSPYSPVQAYKRLAGEAEARATQSRMNMNMDQRLNTYPLDSYDVPVDQLIIRGNTPIGAAFGGK